MSFEGYIQYLCPNGHADSRDVYEDEFGNPWACHHCGEPAAWWNMVDLTNGSYGEWYNEETDEFEEGRIDGYIELEVDEDLTPPMCTCQCGHVHATGPTVYKIPPEEVGHHEVRRTVMEALEEDTE